MTKVILIFIPPKKTVRFPLSLDKWRYGLTFQWTQDGSTVKQCLLPSNTGQAGHLHRYISRMSPPRQCQGLFIHPTCLRQNRGQGLFYICGSILAHPSPCICGILHLHRPCVTGGRGNIPHTRWVYITSLILLLSYFPQRTRPNISTMDDISIMQMDEESTMPMDDSWANRVCWSCVTDFGFVLDPAGWCEYHQDLGKCDRCFGGDEECHEVRLQLSFLHRSLPKLGMFFVSTSSLLLTREIGSGTVQGEDHRHQTAGAKMPLRCRLG